MQKIKAKLLEPGMNIFLEQQNKIAEIKQVRIENNFVVLVFKLDEKFYRHRYALNADVMLVEVTAEEEPAPEVEEEYNEEEEAAVAEEEDEYYEEEEVVETPVAAQEPEVAEEEEEYYEEEEEEEEVVVPPPVRKAPAPKPAPASRPAAKPAPRPASRPAPVAAPAEKVKHKYVFGKTWATAMPHIGSLTLTGLIYAVLGLGLLAIPIFLIIAIIAEMFLMFIIGLGVFFMCVSFAIILIFFRTILYNQELQVIERTKDQ